MRRSDDHALGPAEVEHQHGEAAREQRNAQESRQRRARLVLRLAEYGADRRDVERAGRGDDQEDREHVRQARDDAVVHPGDDVAMLFHVVRRREPGQRDESEQQQDQNQRDSTRVNSARVMIRQSP